VQAEAGKAVSGIAKSLTEWGKSLQGKKLHSIQQLALGVIFAFHSP
jgi:hypothetical protein